MNSMPRGAFSSQDKIPSGYKSFAMQQYDPSQMDLYNQDFGLVGDDSFTRRLAMGDQSQFDEMEAPALRQFNELQGNIASRFSGAGLGGRKSSGFQNSMTSASQDFASQLQANRLGLRRQAIMDLMGMSDQILNRRPVERGLVQKPEKKSSGWGGLAGAGVGALGGFMVGGPAGAYGGAQLGYGVGSAF